MGNRVILVGAGNMGYAMLVGWIASGVLDPHDTIVVEPNAELRARAAALGVTAVADAEDAGDEAPRLVVLAVKPQVVASVAPAYRRFGGGTTVFLSVMAGVGSPALRQLLGEATPIIRCMPNTPAAIGKGMMVTFSDGRADAETEAFVGRLLATSGAVTTIPDEELMHAVTAVSGSGPAYIFHFIEALTEAGETAGLPADTARLLAMQTVHGAACLAKDSSDDPATLRRQVTSPNGTTAAALEVLMGEQGQTKLLTEAVEAARARSVELGK